MLFRSGMDWGRAKVAGAAAGWGALGTGAGGKDDRLVELGAAELGALLVPGATGAGASTVVVVKSPPVPNSSNRLTNHHSPIPNSPREIKKARVDRGLLLFFCDITSVYCYLPSWGCYPLNLKASRARCSL